MKCWQLQIPHGNEVLGNYHFLGFDVSVCAHFPERQKHLASQFWRQESEIEVWVGPCFFESLEGGSPLFLPAHHSPGLSLASDIIPNSAPTFHSIHVSSHAFILRCLASMISYRMWTTSSPHLNWLNKSIIAVLSNKTCLEIPGGRTSTFLLCGHVWAIAIRRADLLYLEKQTFFFYGQPCLCVWPDFIHRLKSKYHFLTDWV